MARIAGVDLPNKKRMEYALTYIYGIGLHNSRLILNAVGIDFNKRAFELTEDERKVMNTFVRQGILTKDEYIEQVKSMRGK